MGSSRHRMQRAPCSGGRGCAALTLEVATDGRGSNGWGPILLLTCLEPTGLAAAGDTAQHGLHVPEPPRHVEEPHVRGRG